MALYPVSNGYIKSLPSGFWDDVEWKPVVKPDNDDFCCMCMPVQEVANFLMVTIPGLRITACGVKLWCERKEFSKDGVYTVGVDGIRIHRLKVMQMRDVLREKLAKIEVPSKEDVEKQEDVCNNTNIKALEERYDYLSKQVLEMLQKTLKNERYISMMIDDMRALCYSLERLYKKLGEKIPEDLQSCIDKLF